MNLSKQQQRYEVLDGMRGIAAFCVMMYHYTMCTNFPIFRNAFLAVDLFFILSGFVIAHTYSQRLLNGMSFTEFFCRRVIRLYPMFFMGLVLGGVTFSAMTKLGWSNYSLRDIAASLLCNMLFLPYLNDGRIFHFPTDIVTQGPVFPVDTPMWSLFFELFINMFCLLLFRLNNLHLKRLVLLMYGFVVVRGLISSFIHFDIAVTPSDGWGTLNFLSGFPRVFYGFVFGILLQRHIEEVPESPYASRLKFIYNQPFLLYGLLLMVFLFPFPYGMHGVTYLFMLGFVMPFFVWMGAMSWCKNRLSFAISRFLGWISYPLYCLHMPVSHGINVLFKKYDYPGVGMVPVAISVITSVITAILITKLYEEPLRNELSKRLKTAALRQQVKVVIP